MYNIEWRHRVVSHLRNMHSRSDSKVVYTIMLIHQTNNCNCFCWLFAWCCHWCKLFALLAAFSCKFWKKRQVLHRALTKHCPRCLSETHEERLSNPAVQGSNSGLGPPIIVLNDATPYAEFCSHLKSKRFGNALDIRDLMKIWSHWLICELMILMHRPSAAKY